MVNTAISDLLNDNGISPSTSGVTWDGDSPECHENIHGSQINCTLTQSSGGGGNEECQVMVYKNGDSFGKPGRYYAGTNCYGNTN